ncbi:MAG: hypothetical protein ACPL1Z_05770 [Candidatus Bathyarchaeales archaeon]
MAQVSTAFSVVALVLGVVALALSMKGKGDLALIFSFLGLYNSFLGMVTKVGE